MNIPTSTQVSNVFSGLPSYGLPSSGLPSYGLPSSGLPSSGLPSSGPPRESASAARLDSVAEPSALRDAFDDFVGQTFFQQMLSAMRKTVDKPAYFHGGRAEEVFQGQLDQVLSEHMTKAAAADFTDPLFELYSLRRA